MSAEGAALISKIPADHPHKAEIEAALSTLLAQLADRWMVRIERSGSIHLLWWLVIVTREADGHREVFFPHPHEQTPGGIIAGIQRAIDSAPPLGPKRA